MRSRQCSSSNAFPTSCARSTTPRVWNHLSPSGDSSEEACLAAQAIMLVSVFKVHPFTILLEVFPQTDKDTSFDTLESCYFILTVHATHFHMHLFKTDS